MKSFIEKISFFIVICLIPLSGCDKNEVDSQDVEGIEEIIQPSSNSPNILLIIADDMGKDATFGFSEGNIKPNTPHINNIKSSGITFNNCWVYPTCSPTRASIITGKYGYRTGVTAVNDNLSSTETILHNYIKQQTNDTYATALIGKWHLSGNRTLGVNPENFGMDYYAGLLGGGVQSYSQWVLTENGQQINQTDYITEKFTDLSIDWIGSQKKPWFLWLAYTAPHTPFHTPPSEMHSQGILPNYTQGMNALPYYLAAIETMDHQIGRLLDAVPEDEIENTVIIFIGDNGTPNQVAQSPFSNTTAKGSLYQGGINTPLFVSGATISRIGESDDNLITGTDLYATIADIAGVSITEINDSKSFAPLLSATSSHRDFQYAEVDDGITNVWTISDGQYKLFVNANGDQEMYDLTSDRYENNNLLITTLNTNQTEIKTVLENELTQIRN
ncbi:arylsulfatase A-like enzyme [Aquimarina sp. EL_43]|uniref:sulfatase-like hydrolase/transferase n=1 Tax=unclassified Aquimarina TaxID=2627091 RepID=UPI0018CA4667|nr:MULTISPECIES: sulfatase-like hydrolase/transferase [unclassified Aquimarina]MBG6129982.1 arylsulfatase A-like enzyme [Aquimarina sp. EL_35]MBG6148762.1 arylsulfatase A-like enzyme [Aquimarina sp. EL_32]MBG6168864.1 arylsulfatase A-like enzyme [Aquimarina sp. EL_43]